MITYCKASEIIIEKYIYILSTSYKKQDSISYS